MISYKCQLIFVLPVSDKVKLVDTPIDVSSLQVVELETVDCKTDFEFFVTRILTSMSKDMSDIKINQENMNQDINLSKQEIAKMKSTQDEIVTFLMDKKVTQMSEVTIDFAKKHKYSFPITSLETFLEFDKELGNNKFLKNDIVCFFFLINFILKYIVTLICD